jgi:hypothetical protein
MRNALSAIGVQHGFTRAMCEQSLIRERKKMGYPGSDQPVQRYFVQFRRAKDHRKFKQVDPAQETPVKAPPKRPPTASQGAHWITFKEDQRLE